VILLDANLLLYAHNTSSKEHASTTAWLETALATDNICMSWETILAFLRIATTPRIFAEPLTLEAAVSVIDKWLAQPNVTILSPTPRHWPVFSELLPSNRARGSLIMDAHLAALAIEHGATLCTNDRDFARFPGLKLEFPLQAQ
jgi:toxin-antitoxin system PIN domain toxin